MNNLKDIFSLKNRNYIVTGAAGLLGKHHAQAICAFGGNPILVDLDKHGLNLLSENMKNEFNTNIQTAHIDITNENEVLNFSKDLKDRKINIDGLINNAANNPPPEMISDKNSRLENYSLKQWNSDLSVSLTGSFLFSKHIGKLISENKNGGVILNISSDLGIIAPDQSIYAIEGIDDCDQPVKPVSYSVTKSGIIGLSRYLSTYWAHKGVRSNTLCPGGVENDQAEIFIKRVVEKIPLNRLAKPNEYQGVVVWLLSDASLYLNGAVIQMDGGRTAW